MIKNQKIKLSLVAGLLATSMTGLSAQTLTYLTGWNSLNVFGTPTDATQIQATTIKTLLGDGSIITQGLLNSEDSVSPLTSLTVGKAFYAYNPNGTVNQSFDVPAVTSTSYSNGWNFVGFQDENGSEEDLKKNFNISKNIYLEQVVNGVLNKNGSTLSTKINKYISGNGYWVKVSAITDEEKVRVYKNNFKLKALLTQTFLNNPNWVVKNIGFNNTKLASISGVTYSNIVSSDPSAISTSGVVTIDPTIDKNVTLTITVTSGSYSEDIIVDLVVPSQATIDSILNGLNKITGYGVGTGSTFANGMVVSSDYANFEYYVSKPVDNTVYGTEAGIDYTVFLDNSGIGYTGNGTAGEIKLSFDSSYLDGGEFYVRNTATGELFNVRDFVAYSGYENTTDNVVNTFMYGDRTDVSSELALVNWDLIKGSNTLNNIVQSDLVLPTTIGADGGEIVWETNRKDILDVTTGTVTLPTASYEEVVLTAHVTKKNGYGTKNFVIKLADSSIKIFNTISEADAASLTNGETVIIGDKIVLVNGTSDYTDIYTDENYTTSINSAIFKDGNEAYINRGSLTTNTLLDGTTMTWNGTKNRWERDSDGAMLLPIKNNFTFESLIEYGYKTINVDTLDRVDEGNAFDVVNNLFVSTAQSYGLNSYNKELVGNSNSYYNGNIYKGLNNKDFKLSINHYYENQGITNEILPDIQSINNDCSFIYGKGWRLASLKDSTDLSTLQKGLSYTSYVTNGKITKINEAYFTQSNRALKLSDKHAVANGISDFKITINNSGSDLSIVSLSNYFGYGEISRSRCVFDGSVQQ